MKRLAVVVMALVACRADRKRDDTAVVTNGSSAALANPAGPLKADVLIKQAAEQRKDLAVSRVEASYVRSDGVMDPTYGELSIDLIGEPRRPPPPPDDPNRPTGAPVPDPPDVVDTGPDCDEFRWSATTGWAAREDQYMKMCLGIGTHAGIRCTVIQIWQRALADGAPTNAVAKITAIAGLGWTFAIDDEPRNVHFSQAYDDDCTPAAEAAP